MNTEKKRTKRPVFNYTVTYKTFYGETKTRVYRCSSATNANAKINQLDECDRILLTTKAPITE
jgi:hypothetical protein